MPRVNKVSNYNYLINGDMRISQRGDYTGSSTSAAHNIYYLDRWKTYIANTTNVDKIQIETNQPAALSGSKSLRYVKIVSTSGSNTHFGAYQIIENKELFENKTVTFSCWVKSNSPLAVLVLYESGTGEGGSYSTYHTGGGAWELLTVTRSLVDGITQLGCYAKLYGNNIESGKYVEFTGAKLEIGNGATPFEARPDYEELALCQRYFVNLITRVRLLFRSGANTIFFSIPAPVTMRIKPIIYNNSASETTDYQVLGTDNSAQTGFSIAVSTSSSTDMILISASKTTHGLTDVYLDLKTNKIGFDSEL